MFCGDREIEILSLFCLEFIWSAFFCLVIQHSTSFGQLCPRNFLYPHRNQHLPYPAIQKVLSLTLNTSYFCAWLLPGCFPVMPLPRDPTVCNTTPFSSTSNSWRPTLGLESEECYLRGNLFTCLHDTVFSQCLLKWQCKVIWFTCLTSF